MKNRENFNEIAYLGYRKRFVLLTTEHLLLKTVFAQTVDLDFFYIDPKNASVHREFPSMIGKKK